MFYNIYSQIMININKKVIKLLAKKTKIVIYNMHVIHIIKFRYKNIIRYIIS